MIRRRKVDNYYQYFLKNEWYNPKQLSKLPMCCVDLLTIKSRINNHFNTNCNTKFNTVEAMITSPKNNKGEVSIQKKGKGVNCRYELNGIWYTMIELIELPMCKVSKKLLQGRLMTYFSGQRAENNINTLQLMMTSPTHKKVQNCLPFDYSNRDEFNNFLNLMPVGSLASTVR